jgi:hypothetical protein
VVGAGELVEHLVDQAAQGEGDVPAAIAPVSAQLLVLERA